MVHHFIPGVDEELRINEALGPLDLAPNQEILQSNGILKSRFDSIFLNQFDTAMFDSTKEPGLLDPFLFSLELDYDINGHFNKKVERIQFGRNSCSDFTFESNIDQNSVLFQENSQNVTGDTKTIWSSSVGNTHGWDLRDSSVLSNSTTSVNCSSPQGAVYAQHNQNLLFSSERLCSPPVADDLLASGADTSFTSPTVNDHFWEWLLETPEVGDVSVPNLDVTVFPSATSLPPSHPESALAILSIPNLAVSTLSVVESTSTKSTASRDSRNESKPDRRLAKPVPSRFCASSPITLASSAIQCLGVVLVYNGYTGKIHSIFLNDAITNTAYAPHNSEIHKQMCRKLLSEPYVLESGLRFLGQRKSDSHEPEPISLVSGVLQRKIYVRDISEIMDLVTLIKYHASSRFHIDNPYEPQYYRFELDSQGREVNESKCGLCPFCIKVKFLPFKNSSYLSHLTLEHGVFANSFIVPEGLYYGNYTMVRTGDMQKSRMVKALQCPACFQVVEVACWRNKVNPLLSYFRHFKKHHLNLTKTFVRSTVDPVILRSRSHS